MTTKSKAAAGLCEWAKNIVSYWDVWSTVEPKRQELAEGGWAGNRWSAVQHLLSCAALPCTVPCPAILCPALHLAALPCAALPCTVQRNAAAHCTTFHMGADMCCHVQLCQLQL